MTYARDTILNPNPGGDTTKDAIVNKIDVDLTKAFTCLNAHASSTGGHGLTGQIVGTSDTQTLSNKTLTACTYPDLINAMKGNVAAQTLGIVGGVTDTKGLWIFDGTTGSATVTDRSGLGHNATLVNVTGGTRVVTNWENFTSGYSGFAPYVLGIYDTRSWDVESSADFSPVGTPMSAVVLCRPGTWGSQYLIGKSHADDAYEWEFVETDPPNRLQASFYSPDLGSYIRKTSNANLTDTDQWHVYGMTYTGGSTTAAICIYRDGVLCADTGASGGSFSTITAGNARLSAYQSDFDFGGLYSMALITGTVLNSRQMRAIADLWLGYAGQAV